jgi:hypothetical protein
MNTEATKGQIQQAIQQLYEDEGLTGALTDEPATILLSWGAEQLKGLAGFDYDQPDLVRTAYQLRRVMRAINRLVERQADLSEKELVQRLLKLVERAINFGRQKSIIEQESKDDQKT